MSLMAALARRRTRPASRMNMYEGNARSGEFYRTRVRNGAKEHVYADGDVVRLGQSNPTGGINPPRKDPARFDENGVSLMDTLERAFQRAKGRKRVRTRVGPYL